MFVINIFDNSKYETNDKGKMIHILTLTWNGLDKLKKLKPTLEKVVVPLGQPVRWYIRDNGSTDGTVEWLENYKSQWVDMQPDYFDHNRDNFAKCVNGLILSAHFNIKASEDGITRFGKDDFILLLNNDIEFADQMSLHNMMKLMKDPKIGVVGTRLLYNGTNKLQHGGVIFGKRYGNMAYHYRYQEESDKIAQKNRYFQAVTAACCLIRGSAFEEMDEKFHWCFEDIDLCLRIGAAGWKIAYCGQTKIYHEESATLNKNPVNKMFMSQNVKRFKKKWFGKYNLDHEKYLKNSNYNEIK